MQTLGFRLGALVAVGVTVAGLAQAGWWALLAASEPAGAFGFVWVALATQVLLTVTLAAAVGWQARRMVAQLLASLPAAPVDPLPLRSPSPLPAEPGRRADRLDADTGLDSRFTFILKLAGRLSAADRPQTALVALRLPDLGPASDAVRTAAVRALRPELDAEPQAFAGRGAHNELWLCLPQHQVAAACAERLRAALAETAPGLIQVAVDGLGGSALDAALSALQRALAGQAAPPPPQTAEVSAALVRSRLKLGRFPVVDASGRLLHLECPLRLQWLTEGAFEPAARWLAVAAQGRLLPQVDLAAVDLALQAIAGDGVARCVHVSAESLATAGFVDALRLRLQHSPDATRLLWIEIAELSLARVPSALRNAVRVWRRCGARVCIEHAGATLRDWVRLGELEVDCVKIDGRFVQGLAADAEQRDWLRALVALIHECGTPVVAEGADRADDLQALWAIGFDGATGTAVTARHPAEGTRAREHAQVQAMSPA